MVHILTRLYCFAAFVNVKIHDFSVWGVPAGGETLKKRLDFPEKTKYNSGK